MDNYDETDGLNDLIRNHAPELIEAYQEKDLEEMFEIIAVYIEYNIELQDENAQLRQKLHLAELRARRAEFQAHRWRNRVR